jgi:hypothetical protein
VQHADAMMAAMTPAPVKAGKTAAKAPAKTTATTKKAPAKSTSTTTKKR